MKVLGSILLSLALLGVGGMDAHAALPSGTGFATLYTGTNSDIGRSWCPACNQLGTKAGFSDIKQGLGDKLRIVSFDGENITSSTNFPSGVTPTTSPTNSYPALTLHDSSGKVLQTVSGPDNIASSLQELASLSSQAQEKPGEALSVATKYKYVGPGLGQFGPSEELILHGRPLPPGQLISDSKQQVLAINVGTGRGNAVQLGGAFVGAGPYQAGPLCQENRAPGSPQSIRLPRLDENSFEACKDSSQQGTQQNNSTQGGSNPLGSGFGSGGGTNPGGSDLGSSSLLPLLMQSLLGQGLGGGQGGQNPYGNQYSQQQQQNCASIPQSPVCGTDGKTYNNACYLRQAGIAIQKQGVCVQATSTPSPNIAAISSTIVNQLNASGVPAAILEQVRSVVSSVLGDVFSGASSLPETVIR